MVCQPPSTCARSASTVRIELDDTLIPARTASRSRSHWTDLIVDGVGRPGAHDPRRRRRLPTVERATSKLHRTAGRARRRRSRPRSPSPAISRLSGEALMLHAAARRARRRSGHRLRRPVGARQDHRLAGARPRLRLRHRRDAGGPARRLGRALPQAALDRRAPRHKHTEPASALGLAPALGRGAAARRARAARPRPDVDAAVRRAGRPDSRPCTSSCPRRATSPSSSSRSARSPSSCSSTGGVRRVVYSEADTLPGLVDDILAADHRRPADAHRRRRRPRRDCDCFDGLLLEARPHGATMPKASSAPRSLRRSEPHRRADGRRPALGAAPGDVTVLEGVGPIVWLAAERLDRGRARAMRAAPAPRTARGRGPARPSSPRWSQELVAARAPRARTDGDRAEARAPTRPIAHRAVADPECAAARIRFGIRARRVVARSCAIAPRQMPAITNGIDTCAAIQNRSNCACTMRREHDGDRERAEPRIDAPEHDEHADPHHDEADEPDDAGGSRAPPSRPAAAGRARSRLGVPVAEAVTEDRATRASSGRPRGTSRAAGTRSCAGSARRSGRRPSSMISQPAGISSRSTSARATRRAAAGSRRRRPRRHEADERLPRLRQEDRDDQQPEGRARPAPRPPDPVGTEVDDDRGERQRRADEVLVHAERPDDVDAGRSCPDAYWNTPCTIVSPASTQAVATRATARAARSPPAPSAHPTTSAPETSSHAWNHSNVFARYGFTITVKSVVNW